MNLCALLTVRALVLLSKSKLIKFDPKLKTVILKILSDSIAGAVVNLSLNLNCRLKFTSKIYWLGPFPALRGKLPPELPIGASEN